MRNFKPKLNKIKFKEPVKIKFSYQPVITDTLIFSFLFVFVMEIVPIIERQKAPFLKILEKIMLLHD